MKRPYDSTGRLAQNKARDTLILRLAQTGESSSKIAEKVSAETGEEITGAVVRGVMHKMRKEWLEAPDVWDEVAETLPERGCIKRYILTAAQNNTAVNPVLAENLEVLADHYGAEIRCAKVVYRVASKNAEVPGEYRHEEQGESIWDSWVEQYASGITTLLAPECVWQPMFNILPTAENPLSGLESHSRGRSLIVPHPRQHMRSIPRVRGANPNGSYTTGFITEPKYVVRKAGVKAHHHHVMGALIVEVDGDGDYWIRQINDNHGSIADLDVVVDRGELTTGNRISGMTVGDLHLDEVDPEAFAALYDDGGLLPYLRPEVEIYHDALETRKSHHNQANPDKTFLQRQRKKLNVEQGVKEVCEFLVSRASHADVYALNSNHERHLARWIMEADYRKDPEDAIFYLTLALAKYRFMRDHDKMANVFALAAEVAGVPGVDSVRFLDEDERIQVEGIECGLHGDRGANGSRGSGPALSKMGQKLNIGHFHSPGIWDGVYAAGTTMNLNPEYAAGPSSWSHTHAVIYKGGKRSLITLRAGKYFAAQKRVAK